MQVAVVILQILYLPRDCTVDSLNSAVVTQWICFSLPTQCFMCLRLCLDARFWWAGVNFISNIRGPGPPIQVYMLWATFRTSKRDCIEGYYSLALQEKKKYFSNPRVRAEWVLIVLFSLSQLVTKNSQSISAWSMFYNLYIKSIAEMSLFLAHPAYLKGFQCSSLAEG